MMQESTLTPARMTADPRTVVLDAYNFSLYVRNGHVIAKNGDSERVISRVDAVKTKNGIARIIILSRVGSISVQVMRWATALDVAIFQVARDGTMGFCCPGMISTDARMYRQQIISQPGMPNEHTGIEIVRELLTAKIAGQIAVLNDIGANTSRLRSQLPAIAYVRSIREMQGGEGNAARAYWDTWKERVFVPWEPKALDYLPMHWSRFNGRAWVVTQDNGYGASSNRNATDFVNACLNYAYKIGETEAMYACYAVGMHPALGLSHGEIHDGSPAMALDILEPLRPIIDSIVLSYLDCGKGFPFDHTGKPVYISRKYAQEADNGTCLLNIPFTANLASAVSMAVAPHAIRWAEHVAKRLTVTKKMTILTPFDPRLREHTDNRLELAGDITLENLVPDHVWQRIQPLIPTRRYQTSNLRILLAVIIAHERYGIPWKTAASHFPVNRDTCQIRFREWRESGIWDTIVEEFMKPGISQVINAN
jgi:CRISP-associated protein Cas1